MASSTTGLILSEQERVAFKAAVQSAMDRLGYELHRVTVGRIGVEQDLFYDVTFTRTDKTVDTIRVMLTRPGFGRS